jgi:hypothetical protein
MMEMAVAEAIRRSLEESGGDSTKTASEASQEQPPCVKEEPVVPPALQEDEATKQTADESLVEEDIVVEASAPMEGEVAEHSANDSFASDAAGSGEIAAALGETLDMFAKAIDAVSSEFDRKPAAKGEDDEDDDEDFVVDAAKEKEFCVDPDEEEQGTKIIEGPDDDVKDDASHDSWHVVVEDQQIAYDEAVARAAQMIGSALFNSDLANSAGGEVSVLSHSVRSVATGASNSTGSSGTSVSSATSVPTIVPSLGSKTTEIPVAQLDRWAIQLKQLHELGFYKDALCVDILERLTAANIGVDSEDEVSVTQVVNELMKDW